MKHERIPSISSSSMGISRIRVECCVLVEEWNAVVQRIRHDNDDMVVIFVVASVLCYCGVVMLCCVPNTGTFINMLSCLVPYRDNDDNN